jgi:uncharacterized protein YndB with AHSA1/START domain
VIVRREQTLPGSPEKIWNVVSDPHRLPAWWPGVTRVEEASPEAWTKVLLSPGGKAVRADYTRLEAEPPVHLKWRQELDESPFERLLHSSTTAIDLTPAAAEETRVRIAVEHRPRGWARLSPLQMRAATVKQVQGALEGLERLLAGEEPV